MFDYDKYLRKDRLPHIWCPGCGHGIVMKSLLRAIERAGLDQDKTAVVSGIGCASRLPTYVDFDTLHTTHGRALAFATAPPKSGASRRRADAIPDALVVQEQLEANGVPYRHGLRRLWQTPPPQGYWMTKAIVQHDGS